METGIIDRGSLGRRLRSRGLWIEVSVPEQCLRLCRSGRIEAEYAVSTARNGVGEQEGSNRTPRGWHVVRAKVGTGAPYGTVFRGRRPTGEIYSEALALVHPKRDWILTRILWLSGLEPGFNRLGSHDSMRRYIYIHGCPDRCPMGVPESAGCIRMRNADVIELYDRVPVGTPILIHE